MSLSNATNAIEECVAAAPLVMAWQQSVTAQKASFTIPGHKGRAGRLSGTLGRMLDADVPLYGGLDTPKLERGVLTEAEHLAAACWGASWCRFSTGGSTHANQVFALAVGKPGDTVLVSRTAHRSMLSGLVLAGLRPVWLPVELDPRYGMTAGVSTAAVAAALRQHPDAVALFLVEPGYTGVQSAVLGEVIDMAHDAGLTVIVDQAWGAHFGFHPDYPRHAMDFGADAMVLSAHKTLPAFSQAAYVLARGDRFDHDRLERCFEVCATTSPAGAILASLDAGRALLSDPVGAALLDQLRAEVALSRETLRNAGFEVPGPEDFEPGRFDPAKLILRMGTTGHDGIALERVLARRGIHVEMADRFTIVPIVGLVDDTADLAELIDALTSQPQPRQSGNAVADSTWSLPSETASTTAMSPRDAFFAPSRPVPIHEAAGEICAEIIAPYPPGVPVFVPGELIEPCALDTLQRAATAGARIAYAADRTLQTILVVDVSRGG